MPATHATPKSLLGFLEQVKEHVDSPVGTDYPTIAEYIHAEIEFARAWGLAVGLVEAGYIEAPFSYTVREVIDAALVKVASQIEFDQGVRS